MNLGYIRVSTKEQCVDRQIEELKKYNIDDRFLFVDVISGTTKANHRPKYEILKQVARDGDTIYIHELDRLGRSKNDILEELRYYKKAGITLRILDIPTTLITYDLESETGKLIFEMINNILIEVLATLAEQEVKRLHKRQEEGIRAARLRGVKFGRPKIPLTKEFEEVYYCWKRKEITAVKAYTKLHIKKNSFYNLVKRFENGEKISDQ